MTGFKPWQGLVGAVAMAIAISALLAPGPILDFLIGNSKLVVVMALCAAVVSTLLFRLREKRIG